MPTLLCHTSAQSVLRRVIVGVLYSLFPFPQIVWAADHRLGFVIGMFPPPMDTPSPCYIMVPFIRILSLHSFRDGVETSHGRVAPLFVTHPNLDADVSTRELVARFDRASRKEEVMASLTVEHVTKSFGHSGEHLPGNLHLERRCAWSGVQGTPGAQSGRGAR